MAEFHSLGLVVEDMGKSLAFYRRLGLDIPAEADTESHVEANLPGGLKVMFDTVEIIRSFSEWNPPTGGHRIALAFQCGTPEDVDNTFASLIGEGYRRAVEPFDAFWGQRYATVLDPDGNHVDLFATNE
jgi:uncharacterized glyoxalase superfamily protein PhnB